MTHQEMIDDVAAELRDNSISNLITTWLNMAAIDVADKFVFGTLNAYDSKDTVAGNPDVTLATDFMWMKNIQIPASNKPLYPKDEQVIAAFEPNYRTLQGEPEWYYLNANTLGLFEVPGAIYTITYSYQKKPPALASSSDILLFPEPFHLVVTQKAKTRGYRYQKDVPGKLESEAAEKKILKDIGSNAYRRPDVTHVFSGPSERGRMPKVRFPPNYPRVW